MAPSLLCLPTELRLQIYAHLLTAPSPLTLYNDDHPHRPFLPIYPAILRSCRMIGAEALPVLYHHNVFLIMLCTHQETAFNTGEIDEGLSTWEPLLIQEMAMKVDDRVKVARRGLLGSDVLRRMRHVEIVTEHNAIWGSRLDGRLFSETRETIVEALRAVAEESLGQGEREGDQRASLRIIVLTGRNDPGIFDEEKLSRSDLPHAGRPLFLEERIFEAQNARLTEVVELLERAKEKRVFEVWEERKRPGRRSKGEPWEKVNVTSKAIEMFKVPRRLDPG